MKITIQNIGIISEAAVEVNGITLIAGPNDSGKSTIGKIFYSLVRGLNPDEVVFISEKNETIRNYYQQILRILRDKKEIDVTHFQTSKINETWTIKVREVIEKFDPVQRARLKNYCNFLDLEFDMSFNSMISRQREVQKYFALEFEDEIKSLFDNRKITRIFIEDIEGTATIEYDDSIDYFKLNNNINTFYDNSFFIETPSLIDSSLQDSILFEERFSREKKTHLKFALANKASFIVSEYSTTLDINKIIEMISKIINGQLVVDDFQGVVYEKNGKEININNVALGIKGFGLIQLLLRNEQLNSRTLLIIDEPEIHLHPMWQVKYAEILVLISKNLEIPILLTSHSPYFIEALKAFSEKYKYSEKTKFYFTEKSNDGLSSKIVDVSSNISPILVSISEAHFNISDIENE